MSFVLHRFPFLSVFSRPGLVKSGDVIAWRDASTKTEYYKTLVQEIEDRTIPNWLTLDMQKLVGRVLVLPTAGDIEVKFDEKAIVEYYSR